MRKILLAKYIVGLLFVSVVLSACTRENNYRGVADPHWQELSGEQKQLIVDQAYEQEFKENVTSNKK